MDVLRAESVFVAIFEETFAGIYHKDAGAMVSVLFVNNDNTSGDPSPVKQIGR